MPETHTRAPAHISCRAWAILNGKENNRHFKRRVSHTPSLRRINTTKRPLMLSRGQMMADKKFDFASTAPKTGV